jgi:hypothetical protein
MSVLSSGKVIAMNGVEVGALYKHYKGKIYQIIAIARDCENPEIKHVIYKACYNCPSFGADVIWSRPYTMFVEDVVIEGKRVASFEKVNS